MGSSRCRMEGSGSVSKLQSARADSLRAAGVPMASNLSSHLSRNPSSSCSPVVELRPGRRRGSWGPVASQNCRNQWGVCSRARAYTVIASAETHHCRVGLPGVNVPAAAHNGSMLSVHQHVGTVSGRCLRHMQHTQKSSMEGHYVWWRSPLTAKVGTHV